MYGWKLHAVHESTWCMEGRGFDSQLDLNFLLCRTLMTVTNLNMKVMITKLFFSFLAEANQDATKTVIEAVVADHGGTDKCPWTVAEMKGW